MKLVHNLVHSFIWHFSMVGRGHAVNALKNKDFPLFSWYIIQRFFTRMRSRMKSLSCKTWQILHQNPTECTSFASPAAQMLRENKSANPVSSSRQNRIFPITNSILKWKHSSRNLRRKSHCKIIMRVRCVPKEVLT